ncbi:hypothetical protein PMAYCL1PPCAC_16953 [Pristionchus mayeri]|uniref:glucuronosyltransferase n=1 Tax=Pristionchus mayeri TaxID=1317129 RepID=A0AAN5CLS3_9BILA|nr:hypothetical protein PMAYCL1PPCAC_16953 [Pristionchus mayeri]
MRSIGLILLLCTSLDSYKILIYNSKYGHSHSNFLGSIADALVDAGHDVTSLIPVMNPKLKDGTENSKIIRIEPDQQVLDSYAKEKENYNYFELNSFNPLIAIFMGPKFPKKFEYVCRKVLDEPGLIDRLKAEHFDVYISENFDVCGTALAHAIAPKTMIGSYSSALTGQHFSEFGVPEAISYRPAAYMTSLDVHSMVDRAWNFYASLHHKYCFWFLRLSINRLMKERFGEEYPSVAEQSANVAYVLTNSEPLIEFAAPTMARVINVPGIGAKTPKPLDEYWSEVMTRRDQTILLSFGSVVKSIQLHPAVKAAIVKTISRFPSITFIWKYEEPDDEFAKEAAAKLPNLVLTKWMPQLDILAHPRLYVFITHGGMGSTQETALRGVPGIFVPIFGDQMKNAGMMEYNGFGKVFDKNNLGDADKLTATIKEVLENKKYRENAQRISKMLAKKPFSSKEQLVKYVEFAAEFGASAALRPQSVDMSFVTYHNLDVILASAACIFIFVYLICKMCSRTAVKLVALISGKTKNE